MKTIRRAFLCASLVLAFAARAATDTKPGPDSLPQPGVPKGEVLEFTFDHSRQFPGTTRNYWIYVPAQYRPETPACLFVAQDGVVWNAPTVLDNLIAKKEIPVMIGVFVQPGIVKAAGPDVLPRFNRSFEYDTPGDAYVRFLLDELLPEVATRRTSDGRAIRISDKASDRAIGGQSSGAIAAFTAAWERPDSFSRVFSAIGTYVPMRGGNVYQILIRETEPKPIRVFLQDGSNDQQKYDGDWWMANQTMERALVFAGYEVNHVWGDGAHSGKHATAIFPDALRWLWSGWPGPVGNGPTGNDYLSSILIPGEGWQIAADGLKGADGVAVNARGEVFFCDTGTEKSYKIGPDGAMSAVLGASHQITGQAFGPDGRLYATGSKTQTTDVYADGGFGPATTLATGFRGNDLVVAHNGNVYITDPPAKGSADPGRVWLIRPSGAPQVVDTGIRFPNGITLTADQTQLLVDDYYSHWVYSFMIQPDGSLADKEHLFRLHQSDSADQSGADGMHADRDGRIYVTSYMGIQVCDQAGRVHCIIPTPNPRVVSVCLGGANFDTLYAGCGTTLYKRKVKVSGANAWDTPNRPPPPPP